MESMWGYVLFESGWGLGLESMCVWVVCVLLPRGGAYMQATNRWLKYMETEAKFEREQKPHLAGNTES